MSLVIFTTFCVVTEDAACTGQSTGLDGKKILINCNTDRMEGRDRGGSLDLVVAVQDSCIRRKKSKTGYLTAMLTSMVLISLRHKQKTIFLALHLCGFGQKDIAEISHRHQFLAFFYSSHFFLYQK